MTSNPSAFLCSQRMPGHGCCQIFQDILLYYLNFFFYVPLYSDFDLISIAFCDTDEHKDMCKKLTLFDLTKRHPPQLKSHLAKRTPCMSYFCCHLSYCFSCITFTKTRITGLKELLSSPFSRFFCWCLHFLWIYSDWPTAISLGAFNGQDWLDSFSEWFTFCSMPPLFQLWLLDWSNQPIIYKFICIWPVVAVNFKP